MEMINFIQYFDVFFDATCDRVNVINGFHRQDLWVRNETHYPQKLIIYIYLFQIMLGHFYTLTKK